MDAKERLWTAWNFREPDRVPMEMFLTPSAAGLPGADEILSFQENEADNFRGVGGFDWGFMGLDSDYREEVVEDLPGQYWRVRRTHATPAGEFTAITRHTYADLEEGDPSDYHWEKRFIETVDDFRRVALADRNRRGFDLEAYNRGCREIGSRGLPITGLFHPLGALVRNSNMAEVYAWILTEEKLTEAFLERTTEQVVDSIHPSGTRS